MLIVINCNTTLISNATPVRRHVGQRTDAFEMSGCYISVTSAELGMNQRQMLDAVLTASTELHAVALLLWLSECNSRSLTVLSSHSSWLLKARHNCLQGAGCSDKVIFLVLFMISVQCPS